MSTFIISYDLNKPGQDYSSLYEEIKTLGSWRHNLDSTWVVNSSLSAEQIRDRLWAEMDNNDAILVAKSAGIGAWSGLDNSASKWLKARL